MSRPSPFDGSPMVTHLSHHPGPDPRKNLLAWGPLCNIKNKPGQSLGISPRTDDVDCPDCVTLLWSGEWTGFLSQHQDGVRSKADAEKD